MARFRVYRLRQGGALVLDLQADILSDLQTRNVAPLLLPGEISRLIARLNPKFEIGGRPYVMATQFMGVVAVSEIGETVADLTSHADAITAATDFLFQGF
ncbi:pirin [Rhizobium sp. Root73]|uniref:CcdB family protein n=1 Tax=unclassified Rhizobium TaxID=2613769 RepID=UPI00071629C7|nr:MULTISPECIES: CcdB family protein [unclassified Rhizobium]KQV42370.1 pirin [Rhizobium sp. Root1204]KQY18262.1 pirin [Rhizobium sp. Root1334]KRB98561.1 pirin [Rhizobium sp. Root73]